MTVYWAGLPDTDLRSIDDDGGNETLLNGTLEVAEAIHVDTVNEKIWVSDRHDGGDLSATIENYNLDGTGKTTILSGAGVHKCLGITVDTVNSKVYWTHKISAADTKKTIKQADLDGTNIVTILAAKASGPEGVTVDPAGGKVYWTESAEIHRADLDGSNEETLFDNAGDGLVNTGDLELDVPNSEIYWVDQGTDKVQKGNFDGSGSVTDLISENAPSTIGLDSAGGKMYWSRSIEKLIRKSDLDGSNASTIFTHGSVNVSFMTWAPAVAASGARKTFWGPWYHLAGPGSSFGQSLPK